MVRRPPTRALPSRSCQDGEQRGEFLHGTDHQLTGHHWHASASPDQQNHVGRQRVLFVIEADAHRGRLEA